MPECRPRAELIQELAEACILRHLRAAGKALPVFSPRKRARKRTWGWLHLCRAPSTDRAALQSCPCSFSNAEEMDELSSGTSSVVTTRQSCQGGGRVSSLQPAVCFLQAHRGHRYTRVGHAHKGPAEKKIMKTTLFACPGAVGTAGLLPAGAEAMSEPRGTAALLLGTAQPTKLALELLGHCLQRGCAWKFHLNSGCAWGRMTQALWCHFSLPALIAPSCNNWKRKNK